MAPQREWFEKDYYKVLGVPETATDKEIAKAYRGLAKKYHPDANPGSEDRFKEISAAYDVLGDSAKRKEYDQLRAQGPMFTGAGGPGGFAGAGPTTGGFRVDDLGDLIGNIFNRGPRGRGAPSTGGPQRGADLEADLTLAFLDAVNGLETTVNVTSEAPCHVCGGSGAAPGTAPVVCPDCGGTGVLNDNQGLFSFSRTCPTCLGTGRMVVEPCPACHGAGTEVRARQVKARIPAGVDDGQRIRLKNRGAAGRNGGPAGDLYIVVHVGAHPVFGRKGRDLTVSVPVTYPELALGATVSVPTLGKPVSLKVPAGSKSGRTLRVKGRGVPASKGAGDLLVTLDVVVPSDPDAEQLAAIEKLAAVSDGAALRSAAFGQEG